MLSPPRRRRARRHPLEGSPLAFSVIVHLAVVLLCGSLVFTRPPGRKVDHTMESGLGLILEEPTASAPASAGNRQPPADPTASTKPLDALVTNGESPNSLLTKNAAKPEKPRPHSGRPGEKPLGLVTEFLPASMAARTGADARHAALLRMGGSEGAEKGAVAGLRWLKHAQNKDGSWGRGNAPAFTGLALLCFLGHGELPDSPEFGEAVRRGVDSLVTVGARSNGKLCTPRYFDHNGVYEHAIATYALAEYYTMTRDERVKGLVGVAASYIVQAQAADGGWVYSYARTKAGSDTSVSGWQIQALKATYLAGLTGIGVEQALDKSMANLQRVRTKSGGFGYRDGRDRDGYTLAGVGGLCAYLRWSKPEPMLDDAVRYILERAGSDQPVQYRGPNANIYAWYYDTQACLMKGGEAWERWNGWFQKELLENQNDDGSFPPTGATHALGIEVDPGLNGQLYRTTLCTLMLESYYRHLPSSQ